MTTAPKDPPSKAEEASASTAPPTLPKATVKKPVRPDFAERDTKVQKLQDKVQEFTKRSKEITKILDDIHNAGRTNNKQEKCKRELADMRHMKQQLQKRRDLARAKLQEVNSVVNGKSAVKKGLEVASAEDISAAMASLHNKLNQTSDQEQQRRIMEQIQKLHASYEQVTGGKVVLGPEHNDKLREQLTKEMASCTAQLEALVPQEEAARARLEQLQAEQQASEPDIQALRDEREQISDIISQLRDKITEIRTDWQDRFTAFKDQMELWKAEQDTLRAQRDAYFSAEREQKNAERKARELESVGPPFTEEILRCEQLLAWCQKYQAADAANGAAAKASVDAPALPAGFITKTKVSAEDENNMLSLSKAKNKKKAPRKSQPSAAVDAKANTKLQLDLESLALFSKLRLPVPSTVADVPPLVERVAAKKAEYLDKQRRTLAGETVENEQPEAEAKAGTSKAAPTKDTVIVDMRSDEVFGTVLLELLVA